MQSQKKKSKPSKAGPPIKYNPKVHLPLVKYMCKAGAIDTEIAAELGIVPSTLYEWKKKYPKFAEVMADNKTVADDKVEQALYDRATGIEYEEITEEATEIEVDGEASDKMAKKTKTIRKYIAGDVTAQIFWLKNRRPDKWRDKQEFQHTVDSITKIEIIQPEKPKE